MIERLGIFGGTFDPPHVGHQILAAEAMYQLRLEKVLWVLTPDPPHKRDRAITPLFIRLEMVQAAITDCPKFGLSRVEIDRPSPHYAADTIRLLREQYQGSQIVYLMGGDSLNDLSNWYDCQKFVTNCHILGVMRRPKDEIDLDWLETQIPGITPKVRFFKAPLLEIAASQIRAKIRQGSPFRYYLPPPVYQIIKEHNLYSELSERGSK